MGKAGSVNVRIADIELDTSIQCRAKIDTGTVNEYAQRMSEGDKFPPVDLFESDGRYWIGDGWHRVLAVIETSGESIAAIVHPGGRTAALMHALSANAVHGQRRTNEDKRRCVEIALREFPKSSSRSIADLCGVSDEFVRQRRGEEVPTVGTCVTGKDGKEYPARRKAEQEASQEAGEGTRCEKQEVPGERPRLGPPQDGMDYARLAVMQLEMIRLDDLERREAFTYVRRWIDENETT